VLGNLITVVEPDPANQPGGTLTTSYTYEIGLSLRGLFLQPVFMMQPAEDGTLNGLKQRAPWVRARIAQSIITAQRNRAISRNRPAGDKIASGTNSGVAVRL